MTQVTTCSFFKMDGTSNKLWAFKQMQFGLKKLKHVDGLSFYKLMGSGGKNGFSAIPNFSTYVLMAVWKSEEYANSFFAEHLFFNEYKNKSTEQFSVYLHCAGYSGYWDGKQPFEKAASLSANQPIMVLTRASIQLNKLFSFWRRVNKVSHSLNNYDGVALSIGVGEWPLIQQATLSLWTTQAEMLDYAYKNKKHIEVVKLTRQLNWYKEEMFVRFSPYRFTGVWQEKKADELLRL